MLKDPSQRPRWPNDDDPAGCTVRTPPTAQNTRLHPRRRPDPRPRYRRERCHLHFVNAVLLRDLPVSDPKSLVRIGDRRACCVGKGVHDDGDDGLFSTDKFNKFRSTNTDFSELAAMEAGYEYRPLTA